MAFKSFKYKLYSKGYHCSATQKSATSFFDSSYQYLRQNQGLVNLDTAIPQSSIPHLNPHPVIGANVNFNIVDDVLLSQEYDVILEESINKNANGTGDVQAEGPHSSKRNRASSITINQSKNGRAVVMIRRNSMGDSNRSLFPPLQKDIIIDRTLSKRYYTNAASPTISGTTAVNNASKQQQIQTVPQIKTEIDEAEYCVSPWDEDTEPCLNSSTFLKTHMDHIDRCYQLKDYNMINSLYQALKRNGIVPPIETYSKVLESLSKRDLDEDDVDYKMSELLTCYQDMIVNKLKPSDEIYNTVLGCLYKGAILAYKTHNSNGLDFYKIASELFQAIDTQHKHHQFSKVVLDHAILAMNLYPGHISVETAQAIVNSSPLYKKDSFYYLAFISHAKLTNDKSMIKSLYEEYRISLSADPTLQKGEFEVYAMVISGLVETGDLELAIKLLDRLMNDIKEKNGLASNVSLILSNFLISVSKVDCHKAHKLWSQFHKIRWVPEFSYEFYLVLMANSFEDWKLTKSIYECIFPMKPQFKNDRSNLSDFLVYPMGVESVMSSLMDYALQLRDNEVIMKVLEESIIKNLKFDTGVYSFIFAYLKEIRCPDDYLLRFIESHGSLLKDNSVAIEKYEFLNGLIDHFPSQVILKKVAEMNFFADLCRNFNLADSRSINYGGLIGCMRSLWRSPQTIDKYAYNLQIHAILITRLLDFDTYCAIAGNEMLIDFRDKVEERFKKLATNYKRLNLDPNEVPGVVSQAIKMTDLAEEVVSFYGHPGDWDKSYPLALGSAIRNSVTTGIKEFRRLQKSGYCFDYDTYKQLITQGVIDTQIISNCLELCPDKAQLKFLTNLTVIKCSNQNLEELVLKHPLFQSKILPSLKDESLLRLAKNSSSINLWIQLADFPKRFKSIAVQADFKSSIEYVYLQLYHQKDYSKILGYNKICPALNMEILLKSCIRSGDYALYRQMFDKFREDLGPAALDIQSEYLINNFKVDEAVNLIKSASVRTPHKTLDIYTFGLFLQSFHKDIAYYETPENTLQFANLLSTQSNFAGMLALYDMVSHSELFNFDNDVKYAVKAEILEQMLNNLHDATSLIDGLTNEIKSKFASKLQNYFRFRAFLKLPQLALQDMKMLLHIWERVYPSAIDALFNNMVESIYLNPNGRALYLDCDMTFNFKPEELLEVSNDIEEFYRLEKDDEDADKVKRFKLLLKEVCPLKLNEQKTQ